MDQNQSYFQTNLLINNNIQVVFTYVDDILQNYWQHDGDLCFGSHFCKYIIMQELEKFSFGTSLGEQTEH